jgi:hypothetical protein
MFRFWFYGIWGKPTGGRDAAKPAAQPVPRPAKRRVLPVDAASLPHPVWFWPAAKMVFSFKKAARAFIPLRGKDLLF